MNIMDSIARLAAPSKMTGMQENSDLEAEPLSSSAKFVIPALYFVIPAKAGIYALYFLMTTMPLWPPKPSDAETATSMLPSTPLFGT